MNMNWQDGGYGSDELDEEQFKYREKMFNSMVYDQDNRTDSDFDRDYDPDFD